MLHRDMEPGREKKSQADFGDCATKPLHRHLNIQTERFHDIGTSTTAACRAVSMFRDLYAGAGGHKRCGSRNVEGAGTITARATGIEYGRDFTVPQWLRLLSHHSGKSDELGRRLALHPQRRQEARDLRICSLSGHDLFHDRARLLFRQVRAFDKLLDDVGDHCLRLQEILQEVLSNHRHDRFRMKLNSFSREVPMAEAHDDTVLGFGADRQARWNLGDHERVIPRGWKSLRQAAEESVAVMKNLAGLAVH